MTSQRLTHTLSLTQEELAALKASLSHRLEEMASLPPLDAEGLCALMKRVEGMEGNGSARMGLSPEELALLDRYIWHSFGLRGYIVGRPEAVTALASFIRKLARLKEEQGKPSWITRLLKFLKKG